jgi:hypothetical protein
MKAPAVPARSQWKIAYSLNIPAWMSGTEGNWYFDFPSQNGVSRPAIRVGQTITMHHHRDCILLQKGHSQDFCRKVCRDLLFAPNRVD